MRIWFHFFKTLYLCFNILFIELHFIIDFCHYWLICFQPSTVIFFSTKNNCKLRGWKKTTFRCWPPSEVIRAKVPYCVENVRVWSYSGPYFPAFPLKTERYSVSLCIQSKCGKIRTRITPNMDTFHAVPVFEKYTSVTLWS